MPGMSERSHAKFECANADIGRLAKAIFDAFEAQAAAPENGRRIHVSISGYWDLLDIAERVTGKLNDPPSF